MYREVYINKQFNNILYFRVLSYYSKKNLNSQKLYVMSLEANVSSCLTCIMYMIVCVCTQIYLKLINTFYKWTLLLVYYSYITANVNNEEFIIFIVSIFNDDGNLVVPRQGQTPQRFKTICIIFCVIKITLYYLLWNEASVATTRIILNY